MYFVIILAAEANGTKSEEGAPWCLSSGSLRTIFVKLFLYYFLYDVKWNERFNRDNIQKSEIHWCMKKHALYFFVHT